MSNEAIRGAGREIRKQFDGAKDARRKMRPGDVAAIKRLGRVTDALVDGSFWALTRPFLKVAAQSEDERAQERAARALAIAVCAFGATSATSETIAFGRWMHDGFAHKKIPADGAAMRFRRLVAARTDDELAHQLRSLLKLIGQPLDWGTLVDDVVQWSRGDASRDVVLRRWAHDFYGSEESEDDYEGAAANAASSAGKGTTEGKGE